MPRLLEQLDYVIYLASEELTALKEDRLDDVELFFAERSELMKIVYLELNSAFNKEVEEKMLIMQNIQQKLYQEVLTQRESVRDQLNDAKKQTKRLQAYHKTVQFAL